MYFRLAFLLLVFQVSILTALGQPVEIESPAESSKIFVYCIKGWQHISYRTPLLNCQFEHNCSQFAIDSLNANGLLLGTIQTTNRLIRCNPLARLCYSKEQGMLIDDSVSRDVNFGGHEHISSSYIKSVLTASAFIPGLGKLRAGKWSDAVFVAAVVTLGALSGANRVENGQYIRGGISLSMVSLVYVSDVYWSLRWNRRVLG